MNQEAMECSVCSARCAADSMIRLEGHWVCGACKPVFLQRLREGAATGVTVAREGKAVVKNKNAQLPHRCIKCNSPEVAYVWKKKLYWHSPVIYLLILVNILIFVLVGILVRKGAEVEIPLCGEHAAKRKRNIGIAWGVVITGLTMGVAGGVGGYMGILFIGVLFFLAGIIFGISTVPPVKPNKIDQNHVWLSGAGRKYLETLPEWTGDR